MVSHITIGISGRAAYVEFDIPVEEGYIYKFEFTSTVSNAQIGACIVNEKAMNLIQQDTSYGSENQFDTGWETSGFEMEIPKNINGSSAKFVRLNFNANDSSIDDDIFITGVIISRRVIK